MPDQPPKDKPQTPPDSEEEAKESDDSSATLSELLGRVKETATGAVGQAAKTTKDCATQFGETAQDLYKGSKLESGVEAVDSHLEQHGVYRTARETSETIGEKVSEVTGRRLLELLETRLAKQDVYNDTLATRLAETMERIANLERDIEELKKRR